MSALARPLRTHHGHSGSNTSIEQKKKGEPFLGTGRRRLGWVASLWTIPLLYRQKRSWKTAWWHIHSVYTNFLSPTVMQWKIISSRADLCQQTTVQGGSLHQPENSSWKAGSHFECRVTLMFSTTTRHGGPQFANLECQSIRKNLVGAKPRKTWNQKKTQYPPRSSENTRKNKEITKNALLF